MGAPTSLVLLGSHSLQAPYEARAFEFLLERLVCIGSLRDILRYTDNLSFPTRCGSWLGQEAVARSQSWHPHP